MRKMMLALALAGLGYAAGPAYAAAITFSDSGAGPADITDGVNNFRAALGGNNGAGPAPSPLGLASGRREINWDAPALDAVSAPNLMPADQFNRAVAPFARGAQFATSGTGFMVSRRAAQGGDPLFGQAANGVFLQSFSAERIFAPVLAHVMDVTFSVPGFPGARASVSAFGAVFVDVEAANLSSLQFFDLAGVLLGEFFVPTSVDGGLSFLGVQFDAGERIGRVRITTGDWELQADGASIAATGAGLDFVALDDFLYAEPQRVPEPGSLALFGLALGGLAGLARRRRQA